jgi:nicotinate-nucleotide adenylyltransferase
MVTPDRDQARDALVLLGGTFDPVHYGHLRVADEVRRMLAPADVVLVPAKDPPHRGAPRASAADRVRMLELAREEFPLLRIDTREIERSGKSYTVLTLESLRREAPGRSLALLVGADAFLGLPQWHRWRELFALAHVVVATRPGAGLASARMDPQLREEWEYRLAADAAVLHQRPCGAIVLAEVTPQPVSATAIRAALARGAIDEVRGLLPAAVLAYIETHRLYGPCPDAP